MTTVVKGDQKVPFSIASTPKGRGRHSPFPGLLHFTLDMYLTMLSVKQGGIKYHFLKSLVWINLGLNPCLPEHWQTLYPLGQWAGIYLFVPQYYLLIMLCMCVCVYYSMIFYCFLKQNMLTTFLNIFKHPTQ